MPKSGTKSRGLWYKFQYKMIKQNYKMCYKMLYKIVYKIFGCRYRMGYKILWCHYKMGLQNLLAFRTKSWNKIVGPKSNDVNANQSILFQIGFQKCSQRVFLFSMWSNLFPVWFQFRSNLVPSFVPIWSQFSSIWFQFGPNLGPV